MSAARTEAAAVPDDHADLRAAPARPAHASGGVPLVVSGLRVGFAGRSGAEDRTVVDDVSFRLEPGTCLAIVGESGSGKSVTARSLVGLTGAGARVQARELRLGDRDLLGMPERDWRSVRGTRVGFVLQDALVSLDPLRPVGAEIEEALRLHGWRDAASRRRKSIDLLDSVGVPQPEERVRQRPDELSGGLRQRALIASAIALDPEIVIADEPTTALDVTVQAQVLTLLEQAKRRGVSIILISHDLSVVARLADEVLVMRGGQAVEQGQAARVLRDPQHEYTRALIAAVPGENTRGRRLSPGTASAVADVPLAVSDAVPSRAQDGAEPVIEAVDLVKRFAAPGGRTRVAVDGVSFHLDRGETLGIVGESGSGKSTTGRLVLGLDAPDAGSVRLLGHDWSAVSERRRRPLRGRITAVYQDPLSSFDPRWNVERILADALPASPSRSRDERSARIRELVDQVGLPPEVLGRFPLRLSGGQRQRVAIARALAPSPSVIVLDEAVSALDVSIQAQVLDLLIDLQRRLGVSYVFISHDLGVVSHLSDRVLVMKDGRVVEHGSVDEVFRTPSHPYTRELISSLHTTVVPTVDPPGDLR